jgi:hypothetical protein
MTDTPLLNSVDELLSHESGLTYAEYVICIKESFKSRILKFVKEGKGEDVE